MLDTREPDREVGAPNLAAFPHTPGRGADEPQPAIQGPDPAQTREFAVDALRRRFAAYRSAESRALVRVCLAAAYAKALRVPYWMALSQRDYARAILGVKHPTFCRWAKVGRLLCARAELRDELRTGRMSSSELEGMAAGKLPLPIDGRTRFRDAKPSGPAQNAGSEFVCLALTAPAPAIHYMEDSLRLARGFVGVSEGDEEAMGALLAEAAGQSDHRVDPVVARARFRVKDLPRRSEPADAGAHAGPGAPPTDRSAEATRESLETIGEPVLPWRGEAARRQAALRVHALLVRLLARRDQLQFHLEDQLFEWKLDGVHERGGFHDFTRFAEAILDLPYRTCQEHLRRARLRRLDNPIARARREGTISAVQSEILDHLYREAHVPASDLARWCAYAAAHTVRHLRKAVAWAKMQYLTDYRRWALAHCAPPDEDQLRTTDQSLEDLVRDAGGDGLAEALVSWASAPRATLRLVLTRETRDELLVQMASMQDELRRGEEGETPCLVPAWYALCRIFHRARVSWKDHYQPPPASLRRILDRDGWRCAAPECTQRKNLQVHHVRYRSRGGGDGDDNRVTLCAFHHQHGEHGGLMRVRGRLDAQGRGLTWEMGFDARGRALRVYRDGRILASAATR